MLLASVIVNRARTTLIDPSAVHWSEVELYDYLTAAQRAVCQLKPSAYTVTELISLVAGVMQTLDPNIGSQLLDIYFNNGGAGVTHVGREVLTEMNPQWTIATASDEVENWMSDVRDPRRFLVFPPNTGAGRVMAMYAAYPPAVDISTGSSLVIADTFDMALWANVMGQALAKNSRRQDLTKSQAFFSIFSGLVTGRLKAEQVVAPKLDVAEPA